MYSMKTLVYDVRQTLGPQYFKISQHITNTPVKMNEKGLLFFKFGIFILLVCQRLFLFVYNNLAEYFQL